MSQSTIFQSCRTVPMFPGHNQYCGEWMCLDQGHNMVAHVGISIRSLMLYLATTLPKCSHQENMSVQCIPPWTPLLYSKTGVYRGIPIFLIFAQKHRLWVVVRTATIYVLSRNKKNVKIFLLKIFVFTTKKFSEYCMGGFSLWYITITCIWNGENILAYNKHTLLLKLLTLRPTTN